MIEDGGVIKLQILKWCSKKIPEPVFVILLRSPGIDSQPGGIDSAGAP
jgi:hypothetical protein